MSKLFENANAYCRQSDWKDLSLLKVCLIALGVIIGLSIPSGGRTAGYIIAGIVFAVTCVTPVVKFVKIWTKKN